MSGTAFSFDGTNDYVAIPDSRVFHPDTLTVECWVKFDAYQTPGSSAYPYQQYIVFKQNSQNYEFEGFALTKDEGPRGNVILWEVASASHILVRIDSVNTVVTNTWYHLAGVRGSNYVELYLNGHLEAQADVSFPQDYGTYPLYFGTSGQAFYDRRLHGELDEVSLYNRALTSNEIAAIYLAGAAGKCKPAGLAAAFSAPPPRLLPPFQQDGMLHLTLSGTPGSTCVLEVSPDLQHWFPLRPVDLGPGTVLVLEPMTGERRFFRVK